MVTVPDMLQAARRALRRSSACNWLLSFVVPRYRALAVTRRTQIVIEAYPRCANTFSVVAFEMAQPSPVAIAHHLHSVAQLRRGVQRDVPVLVVIRQPEEAVLSVTIRKELASVRWALDEYIDFHLGVLKLGQRIFVAHFCDVTSDYGAVIRRLNERYGTDFGEFDHTEANVAACYEIIDRIEARDAGGRVRSTHVARPSAERKAQKQQYADQLSAPAMRTRLAEAQRLYEELCRRHALQSSPVQPVP